MPCLSPCQYLPVWPSVVAESAVPSWTDSLATLIPHWGPGGLFRPLQTPGAFVGNVLKANGYRFRPGRERVYRAGFSGRARSCSLPSWPSLSPQGRESWPPFHTGLAAGHTTPPEPHAGLRRQRPACRREREPASPPVDFGSLFPKLYFIIFLEKRVFHAAPSLSVSVSRSLQMAPHSHPKTVSSAECQTRVETVPPTTERSNSLLSLSQEPASPRTATGALPVGLIPARPGTRRLAF